MAARDEQSNLDELRAQLHAATRWAYAVLALAGAIVFVFAQAVLQAVR